MRSNADIDALAERATKFLTDQPWCGRVLSMTPAFAQGSTIAVFRAALIPRQPDADVMVWVVVGELSAATVTHEPGDSWQDALASYVKQMRKWENADKDSSRLEWIEKELVDVDPRTVGNDV